MPSAVSFRVFGLSCGNLRLPLLPLPLLPLHCCCQCSAPRPLVAYLFPRYRLTRDHPQSTWPVPVPSPPCPQFHDGMGFLTTHSMLSNTFEYSLQLVNPKLTLPYWDWTIEELDAERESVNGEMIIKSPVFQESWFGTADPDDYVVS